MMMAGWMRLRGIIDAYLDSQFSPLTNMKPIVAILDSGMNSELEFGNRIWRNPYDPVDGVDNDGNGFVDDYRGWNFYNRNNLTISSSYGAAWHGQQVAEYAANQGTGFDLLIVRAADNYGYIQTFTDAVRYVTDLKRRHNLPIVAINISYGGPVPWDQTHLWQPSFDAAKNLGIAVVAAAGNDGGNNDNNSHYPSNFPGVIAVTTSNADGSYAGKNYGRRTVSLGAPATATSHAAPIVAGAIGQFAAENPWATADQIREALWSSIVPHPTMRDRTSSGGSLLGPIRLSTPAPAPPAPAPSLTPALLPRPTLITAVDLDGNNSPYPGEGPERAFGPGSYTNLGGANSGIEFTYNLPTRLSSFVVSAAYDPVGRQPTSYQLLGFNGSWQTLSSGSLQIAAQPGVDSSPVVLPDLPSFTRYRMVFPTVRASGSFMQIRELQLTGSQGGPPAPAPVPTPVPTPAPSPPAPIPTPSPAPAPSPGGLLSRPARITAIDLDGNSYPFPREGPENAFGPGTYTNLGGANSGIEFGYDRITRLTSFVVQTAANDPITRHPMSYQLSGFNTGAWQLLSSGSLQIAAQPGVDSAPVSLPELGGFSQYRLIFPTIRADQFMQIDELKVYGVQP